ncbi:hypothetical protein PVK06_047138 [Gossypium arboreum]|uniref:EGF-like domain-containing protein n=1 Tax=Gossypium arboreum TaxID=29729 RepID=A0ABR0MD18_GOSAR|nr:hypothetical protein PVK06_047138 [Gossypium arboreum]
MSSTNFYHFLGYILLALNINVENGTETTESIRGRICVCEGGAKGDGCERPKSKVDECRTIITTHGNFEHTLRIWGNEFPVLRDVLTWEVPPPKFELIPDKRLRRKPKGQPQVTQIHNDMDIWEPLGQKHCGIYRTVDHNQNKCPYQNYHPGRSSKLGGF